MQQENIVQKIWNLCHILRGDGVSYHEYISELTYLLFLRIAAENETEKLIPDGYRWDDIVGYTGGDLLTHYRDVLTFLGGHANDDRVRKIYAFPTTVFSHSENLRAVIDGIDRLDWGSISTDAMGGIYEGLIAKNSQDARSGAGQYFTPRALIDSIVRLVQPRGGELIQDPAAGSGGFLVSANDFVLGRTQSKTAKRSLPRFEGMEIEKGTYRICLMNAFLHGLDLRLILGDALTVDSANLTDPDVILANPPFGARAGGARRQRRDIPFPTANKQLAFLQHIYLALKPGGRAAVVLPDNVLFEDGVGRKVRQDILEKCNLHTIIRLPTGIFYAQGVMTNVLFFSRGEKPRGNTKETWIYDMRTGMPAFGKKQPLATAHFEEFEACFGPDPLGTSPRQDLGEQGRFRRFTRKQIAARNENLDIDWLRADQDNAGTNAEPEELAARISQLLRAAIEQIDLLSDELSAEGNDAR
ncbi:type I restriction enzyme M protein [Rhodanobacter sp. ANJX3]|uniref:N-6 DNA methylase n=1 Tax=Rhodanobacter sp. ANJX3 TaxID=2723083 RepID=UPI00161BF2FF|nr:type I restriction enzyme M protein [Rhodanobacter sp. ANJX3]